MSLTGVRVLLGVSGGVACYKAVSLARGLLKDGADVQVIMTTGATRFVQPDQFAAITGKPVYTDTFTEVHRIIHVDVARSADVAIIAPATTNVIAKFAAGIADDLVSSTFTCLTIPTVVAPAMHAEMWLHPATQAAIEVLRGRGTIVVGPGTGALAGGDEGPGRLEDEDVLIQAVREAAGRSGEPHALAGRRVLVTAGGTRERLDPVRFLSNRSTGRMGYAVAAVAARLGAHVDLVTAPTSLPVPPGVTVTRVESALEMHSAVMALAPFADVIVKAAAVADFRPAESAAQKIKKNRFGEGEEQADTSTATIRLVSNPDILAELGAMKDLRAVLVGFAAETEDVEKHGRDKLSRKNLDLIAINDVSSTDAGFGTDTNRVIVLGRNHFRQEIPLTDKREIAKVLLDLAAARLPSSAASSA